MMDWTRFGHRPDCVKLFTLFTTILIIMSTSAAIYQPVGTGVIWTTTIIALIADLSSILVLGLGLDTVFISRRHRILTWSLIEVVASVLSAILYFVCIWLCIHGANYGSTTAFTVSGFFCILNFFAYVYSFTQHIQLWMKDIGSPQELRATFGSATSYGAP
uniref:MARVEL domain-containing protein n=2 Tax=Panagrolaimus sp. JU765 TaxID=591449 RepID=A0AC34RS42_9BILA